MFCLSFHWLSFKLKKEYSFSLYRYYYWHADWYDLCDHLRDVPWEDILKLVSAAAADFCEWIQVGIDVNIPHSKYLVKSHSSSWLSASCATTLAIPLLCNSPDVWSSGSDKCKLFAENISRNSNLDKSGDCVPTFPTRINLKLHICVTPKLVKVG